MLKKKEVLNSLKELPGEFTAEELIERILVLEKIERGDKASRNGKVLSQAEVKKRAQKWFS